MPDIDDKNITIELTSEETATLMAAVIHHMISLKSIRSFSADIERLAGVSLKIQNAIIALKEGA